MSIYATWLALDGDEGHTDDCAAYIETPPGSRCFEHTGKPCNCPARLDQPIVYRGSNASPSHDDARGGYVMVCAIPNHCHPDVRDEVLRAWELYPEPWSPEPSPAQIEREARISAADRFRAPVEFLRLSVREHPDTYGFEHDQGEACVILERRHVESLRDTLTQWLEAKERY